MGRTLYLALTNEPDPGIRPTFMYSVGKMGGSEVSITPEKWMYMSGQLVPAGNHTHILKKMNISYI